MKKIKVNGDWFIVEYLEKAEQLGKDKTNENRRCAAVWQNTILIHALTIEDAFDKAVKIAKSHSKLRYKAASGETLQWSFIGIRNIVPVYEDIEDGSELFWNDLGPMTYRKAKSLTITKRNSNKPLQRTANRRR